MKSNRFHLHKTRFLRFGSAITNEKFRLTTYVIFDYSESTTICLSYIASTTRTKINASTSLYGGIDNHTEGLCQCLIFHIDILHIYVDFVRVHTAHTHTVIY